MSQPTPYARQFSFTNDQTNNPSTKTPGNQLDIEYNSILITLTQTLANLALIQRDDGALANGSVGIDQIAPGFYSGLQPATLWATATSYGVGNTVFNGFLLYRCLIAHTSGVFATDLAAAKWLKIADFTAATGVASIGGATGIITLGSNLSMVGQALTFGGVASVGGQVGAITINGGSMTTGVLPVARYDAVQTLSTANQQQLWSNAGTIGYSASQTLTTLQNTQAWQNVGLPTILRGYLSGLTLSTAGSSATFGIAAGVATDSTSADVMSLASAYTKTTSAWAVGTGNGGLDTGAIANSTWYHVYLIKRPDTGVVDVLFSLSASAPTMPGAGAYTLKRRIGSMRTNGSAQWSKFSQYNDEFLWDADDAGGAAFANSTVTSTTAQSVTPTVPTGVKVIAIIRYQVSLNVQYTISPLDQSDQSSTLVVNAQGQSGGGGSGGQMNVRTNTSAQIRVRSSGAGSFFATTAGWIDDRGKLS